MYNTLQKVLTDYQEGKSILKESSKEVFLTDNIKEDISVFDKIDILASDKYREAA